MTNEHDQDDILIRPPSPRFDRRVLLASAAAMGLSAAAGPTPEAWAKGGKKAKSKPKGIPEPKAMNKKEAAIAKACLEALNRARAKVMIGSGDDPKKWSPLQEVVVDPLKSRYVNMHLEQMARTRSASQLDFAGLHDYAIFRNPSDGVLTFSAPEGLPRTKTSVYGGMTTNMLCEWPHLMKRRPSRSFARLLQDVAHTSNLLQGASQEEAAQVGPQAVGLVARSLKFLDGTVYFCLGVTTPRAGASRSRREVDSSPVVWPQGKNIGLNYPENDVSAPLDLTDGNGTAILACFPRTPMNFLTTGTRVSLTQTKKAVSVPGRRGRHGTVVYFIPRAPLKKKTRYRIDVHAEIKPHGKPLIKRDWTRYFTTGKDDYSV